MVKLLSSKSNSILINLVKNNGKSTIKELARMLKVSERSIRYELEKIDDYLLENKLGALKESLEGIYFLKIIKYI